MDVSSKQVEMNNFDKFHNRRIRLQLGSNKLRQEIENYAVSSPNLAFLT